MDKLSLEELPQDVWYRLIGFVGKKDIVTLRNSTGQLRHVVDDVVARPRYTWVHTWNGQNESVDSVKRLLGRTGNVRLEIPITLTEVADNDTGGQILTTSWTEETSGYLALKKFLVDTPEINIKSTQAKLTVHFTPRGNYIDIYRKEQKKYMFRLPEYVDRVSGLRQAYMTSLDNHVRLFYGSCVEGFDFTTGKDPRSTRMEIYYATSILPRLDEFPMLKSIAFALDDWPGKGSVPPSVTRGLKAEALMYSGIYRRTEVLTVIHNNVDPTLNDESIKMLRETPPWMTWTFQSIRCGTSIASEPLNDVNTKGRFATSAVHMHYIPGDVDFENMVLSAIVDLRHILSDSTPLRDFYINPYANSRAYEQSTKPNFTKIKQEVMRVFPGVKCHF